MKDLLEVEITKCYTVTELLTKACERKDKMKSWFNNKDRSEIEKSKEAEQPDMGNTGEIFAFEELETESAEEVETYDEEEVKDYDAGEEPAEELVEGMEGYFLDEEEDPEAEVVVYPEGETEAETFGEEAEVYFTEDAETEGTEPEIAVEAIIEATVEATGYDLEDTEDVAGYEEIDIEGDDEEDRKKPLAAIWLGFLHMSVMDKLITCTGIMVLLIAMLAGGVYVNKFFPRQQENDFISVGASLASIELPGQEGLLAIADSEAAKKAAAEALEEELRRQEEEAKQEQTEYGEEDYVNSITVAINLSSIEKDLKIKFVNKSTGKLISNVPFVVVITDSQGKSEEWKDDDMDGIIYKAGLVPGDYSVEVQKLEDEKYKKYGLPSDKKKVTVKKEIVYEKVDVSDEVKSEAEIDVSKEDTKQHETTTEETLTNTVEWVDSTESPGGYVEVDKDTIVDPTTVAFAGSFRRLAQDNGKDVVTLSAEISASSVTLAVGESTQLKAIYNGAELNNVQWSSQNAEIASVDANGTVTAKAVGTTTITYTATVTVTVSENEAEEKTVSCFATVTVTAKKEIQLDQTSVTVFLGEPVTVNATLLNADSSTNMTVESSDEAIATATINGNVITIQGVKAGSAVITVQCTENNATVSASVAVTVKDHPKDDKATKLVDQSDNQVYVLEGSTYREAVYADYYTATKFYIAGETKYTGWQTIDGKVYYFDANGKKVTGEQVIQGAKYHFASDGSLITDNGNRGIDVSKWNGNIDWKAVKNSGISFVIIRCGYRGYSNGALIEDPKFKTNIQGAIDAGLKVGVYFFTQAISAVEAVEEASMVLDQIKNYRISYPIFLDVEASGSPNGTGRADNISIETRTEVCKAFCQTIQNAGYTAGVYANKYWFTTKINASKLNAYKIWLAQYASAPTYTGKYDMWQYQSTGKVSGISTDVDMNWSYMGY